MAAMGLSTDQWGASDAGNEWPRHFLADAWNETTTTFTLAAEMSYYEAVRGIHDIRGQDRCVIDGTRPPAVCSGLLSTLKEEANTKPLLPVTQTVIGVVPDSLGAYENGTNSRGMRMDRAGQEQLIEEGNPQLEMPSREAAVLARTLVYGATGADLFANLWVRVGGAVLLVHDHDGLDGRASWSDDHAYGILACSGSP